MENDENLTRKLAEIVACGREEAYAYVEGVMLEVFQEIAREIEVWEKINCEEFQIERAVDGLSIETLQKVRSNFADGTLPKMIQDPYRPKSLMEFLKTRALSMASFRIKYPNAFTAWTKEQDALLEALIDEGRSTEEISEVLGRNPNAIEIRLARLKAA